jgi:hypothetical protein
LKVLLVAPSSKQLKVESTSVREALQKLHDENVIKLTCLPQEQSADGRATVGYEEFERALRWNPHVLHFVGHGRHSQAGQAVGQLAFTDTAGLEPRWVGDQQLATSLGDNAPSLHLVFLQACESADSAAHTHQVISGVAQAVFLQSIPAVVAMHSRVQGDVANSMAREFYAKLAEERSVLVALNHARRRIAIESDEPALWAAFGLPVLYLRGSGFISESETAPGGALRPPQPAARKTIECPWCGMVDVRSDNTCPKCTRLLVCPKCDARRVWKTDKCKECEERTYWDAERDDATASHDDFASGDTSHADERLTGGGRRPS